MAETYSGFSLTKEMLDSAHERALELPEYDYSHRKLQANLVGCIGELAFAESPKAYGLELFLEFPDRGIRQV